MGKPITVYGLTNEHGQIMYVGQTNNTRSRFTTHCARIDEFFVAGMAHLSVSSTRRAANRLEKRWIGFFGIENLYNTRTGGNCRPGVRGFIRSNPRLGSDALLYVSIAKALRVQLNRIAHLEDRTIRSVVERALRNELKRGPQP